MGQEPVDVAQTLGRRHAGVVGRVVLGAEQPEQPAHLDESLPGGDLDAAEGVASDLRPLVDDVVRDAGLDGDDAHRVGHHVVQVAGDPQPLRA